MPLPVLGKVIGEVVKEAAGDAVRPERSRSRKSKKSVKAKSKAKPVWLIPLIIAAAVLLFLINHGHR
jgi:hypothetical protein